MIKIRYFVQGKEYASRTREHVPSKGDLVRLKGTIYVATSVAWIEDLDEEAVYIDLSEYSVE